MSDQTETQPNTKAILINRDGLNDALLVRAIEHLQGIDYVAPQVRNFPNTQPHMVFIFKDEAGSQKAMECFKKEGVEYTVGSMPAGAYDVMTSRLEISTRPSFTQEEIVELSLKDPILRTFTKESES